MTELFREALAELAGLRMPASLQAPADSFPADVTEIVGTYERAGVTAEVFVREADDVLRVRTTLTGPLASMLPTPVQEHSLLAVAENEFVIAMEGTDLTIPVIFYALPTGEPYMHSGVRASPKVT